MQLTPISLSPQISQEHQGKVRKLQQKPPQSPLQAEAPILFGKTSKHQKLLLALIISFGLYLFDGLISPTSMVAEPPQKIEISEHSPALNEEVQKKEGITFNKEMSEEEVTLNHIFFFVLFFSAIGEISRRLFNMKNINNSNEAVFKALENNPELMAKFKEVLMNLPVPKLEDLALAENSEREMLILKNMLKTASAIETLLTEKEYTTLVTQTPEIIANNKSSAEAMALYKEALGPDFNWKPIKELITAFMENPTGKSVKPVK